MSCKTYFASLEFKACLKIVRTFNIAIEISHKLKKRGEADERNKIMNAYTTFKFIYNSCLYLQCRNTIYKTCDKRAFYKAIILYAGL